VTGVYENFAPFDGLLARKDDPKFIQLIKDQGALVFKHKYEHDYPFGERSKEPVIYRTTKQWFFRYAMQNSGRFSYSAFLLPSF
jgi:isoleucyl-tRNA synthetase